jgi:hypothetical protein
VNRWRKLRQTAAVLLAAGAAAVAAGQTATYLAPAQYAATVGEQVAVRVEAGDGEAVRPVPWPTERIDWLFIRAPGTQENREDVGPRDPQGNFIEVALTKPGVTLIALDTKPTETTVAGKQFKAFARRTLPSTAYDAAIAGIADAAQVRTRQIESAKTLVRVADPTGKPASHSAVAQSKTGQAVEIRPLADPTMVTIGSDLPVRAYVGGSKQVGVKVLATCVATGKTQEAIADSTGSCHFRISDPGVWRIEFHHLTSPPDDTKTDWVIYSATLTFEASRTGAGK